MMASINKAFRYLYSILAGTVVLLFCIVILQPYVVKNVLVFLDDVFSFNSTISAVLYITASIFLIMLFTLKLFTRKSIQKKALIVSCILLLTYLSYRFKIPHPEWVFIPLHNKLTYFDVLYLLPFLYFVHALCVHSGMLPKKVERLFVKEEEEENDYAKSDSSDASITNPSDDKLDYDVHARKLLRMIIDGQEYYRARAYNIGLLGQWGQGKTSFLNLMRYAVNQDKDFLYYHKAIIVEFNPWFSGNKDQMMVDFMQQIKKTLSQYNPDIKHNIDQYIEVLSQIGIGWFSKLAHLLHAQKSESIQERFKLLNDSIAAIEKPVIVLLDDVDRLLSDEIFAVLQLIRNTANFKNTIFIVSYDKAYITSTLKEGNVIRPDEYLEKIFTMSYNLPKVTDEKLKQLNKDVINATLLIDSDSDESQSVDLFLKDIEDSLSIRQAKILAQNVIFTGALLLKENERAFFLYDLLLVEHLRMKNRELFTYISQAPKELLSGDFGFAQTLSLNRTIEKYKTETFKTDNDFIDAKILPYSGNDKALAQESYRILHLLFDTPDDANAHIYSHSYRLKLRYVFNNYFTRTLPENIILKSDFEKARNGSMDKFKEFLVQRITQENSFSLSIMLENIIFKDEKDGMDMLKASCEIIRDRLYEEPRDDHKILVLAGGSVFGKLYNSVGIIYNHEIAVLHWKVLRNFWKDVTFNDDFEKRFLILYFCKEKGLIDRLDIPFEHKESIFSELYLKYLEVYLKNKNDFQDFNTDFFWCLEKDVIAEYKEKAISLLKDFITVHLESFVSRPNSTRLNHGTNYLFASNDNGQSVDEKEIMILPAAEQRGIFKK